MPRLNPALLNQLTDIAQPKYDRSKIAPGIVHLGIGAFHRAHQAFYTDAVMNRFGGDWGIIGCSLRSNTVQQQLAQQHGLYTLLERGVTSQARVIGAVQQVLVGPEQPERIIAAIATASVKIISLTVTEKGYCHHPSTGTLNTQHPDIEHDIQYPQEPKSAPGYIVAGLQRRCQQNLPPISIISCDNLPNNGAITRNVVLDLAEHLDPKLAHWIREQVTFPGTMIDRIVPATTEDDLNTFEQRYGYRDEGLVMAESFSQWVIEDRFCNGRPAWEAVGALVVEDVDHYETMKLRLLNGSHSLLAYSGYLAGYSTIFKVMQDADFVNLTRAFMATAATTFTGPEGFDMSAYQQQLLERFANPGLQHRTWQIAMDGSQKIPQRWLNTLRDRLANKQDTTLFAFALATWIRYVSGTDENGETINISDPMASTFSKIGQEHTGDCVAIVNAFFKIEDVFGLDLRQNMDLLLQTVQSLEAITSKGVKEALRELLERQE